MTPEELARLHPRLYHVTSPRSWPLIERMGLLSTAALLALFEVEEERRIALTTRRRAGNTRLSHPLHGEALVTNNAPLDERKLAACLEDGLSPADWLRILNARVFFWVDRPRVDLLLEAERRRGTEREVLVFDTLGLVGAHAARVEIAPFNSGSTLHVPARRGLSTFAPLLPTDHAAWRHRRGLSRPDRIVELVVRDGVPDAARHLVAREVAA
ncbi:DUF7002 family protein [Falsiroseomonas sp. CW058]|uniref:DUF7002 family protein n=1 Tax=Falsiroseomonas sp. CW058 TaxID=3388664 RepID=UPI003D316445